MKLETSWRKSTSSSNRIVHVHCCDIEWKRKNELFKLRRKHLIVQFIWVLPYSVLWMNVKTAVKNSERITGELNVYLRGQSDVDKLEGEENMSRESVKLGEVCQVSVPKKELAVEVTQLKIEIRNLKAEIQAINAVKD